MKKYDDEYLDEKEKYSKDDLPIMKKMGKLLDDELTELDWLEILKNTPERTERNKKRKTYITNQSIADEFGISRYKVDAYLRGDEPLDVLTLLKFCKKLNCEAGYILGEFDEKKRQTSDVKKATGLSSDALKALNKKKNSVIYDKTVWHKNDTQVVIKPMSAKDTVPANSKYSDVLSNILTQHPELITMIGQILFCNELKLEHVVGGRFISGLQPNAKPGVIQNNTFEMCMSLALHLYKLSTGKNTPPTFSFSENFNFAQQYITNHVNELKKENTYLKDEITNMEQDDGYEFGARPY